MARNILITRRDWLRESVASIYGGVWTQPLSNLLDPRPQKVAEAADVRDWGSTTFDFDLGFTRKVGLFFFANLRTTSMGLMRIRAGTDPTFASNNYDSTPVSTWPPEDADAFDYNAWNEFALTHVYMADEYEKLGYPRALVPSAPIDCRYGRVEIMDSTNSEKLQIGCFGVYETWEPPINFGYGWSLGVIDDSRVESVPQGAVYVDRRATRRRLSLGFPAITEDETWQRALGVSLIKGRSAPLVAIPFGDAADITKREKSAVYGRISQDGQLTNPFLGLYQQTFQIDQEP